MRVIKVNKKRGNIVLSRKVLLEEENAEKKKTTLDTLAEGKVLRGTVKNLTDYGAFIDLGGIDGLLHITDMSWGRVGHPSEVFRVNDEIDVIVLKYDSATERVSLGHKQLTPDPWSAVAERYPVGIRVSGKVVSGYLAGHKSSAPSSVYDTLTQREREVLKLVAEGKTNKDVAEFLSLSVKTVEKHRSNLMAKLNLHNASGLTAYAMEKGLLVR